ncbi:MAG: accessory Sec system protein translocase subunit SecY2 [Lactobacillus crispatus]|uniref:accessory Sec system protein translocase subunit SecY2 n=1 Tax=Lactobacillus crispatus TaxID=47770 RepID=UPI0018A9034D|nr:accessory Sec system protein translocase subunit SecY2 [Lactobacillus crispatus]MCH4003976.1 accessory Sec system protein translocase subunit SecY2 [Lactobacillus crispatus]MCI1336063.1 accessory Sec system protein translocase subunit SecY2 [Lactobacillus crispatus]MCI1365553.1 accessory Sec system protein translocase subunit SecY2 [Lactobacillus crispatus]MCI1494501.1 accessory Sec system protein translocase subunit SecY2 [Lactobacillus crispatus]MCI1524176.1 accessory Sec system protein t
MADKSHLKILFKRIFITLGIIFIYILGTRVPLPFAEVTKQYSNLMTDTPISVMSMMSGVDFMRLSIFSVGLNPFMIAILIIQLLMITKMFGFDALSVQQVEITQQVIILIFTIIQSTLFTVSLNLNNHPGKKAIIILVLSAGSLLVNWLCFMNIKFGVGGTSPIILVNILTTATPTLVNAIKEMATLPHFGIWIVILSVSILVLIYFWIAFCHAYYPLKVINTSLDSHSDPVIIPLGLNMGAMMTYMMGMAVLTMPAMLTSYFGPNSIFNNLTFQAITSTVLAFVLFYFFTFMQFNPKDQAKALRNSGCYILNVRPNLPSQKYIRKILWIITFPGAILTAFQLTLGLMGTQLLNQYAGFAIVPMNAVMLTMFMNGIKDQIAILLFPHKYYKLQKEE